MSYRAESFWFGQPMHEACLAKPRRSWCLNKFLFDLILKSAVFFTLEQHLTEDVSHQKSGLAWAVVFSGSLGWAGLWLCLCCLWNNHFTLEQHSLHKNYLVHDNSAITDWRQNAYGRQLLAWLSVASVASVARPRPRSQCRRFPNVVTKYFNFNQTLFGL